MMIKPLIGCRIRIGGRLHVNQPQHVTTPRSLQSCVNFSHLFYAACPNEYGFHS